MAMSKIFAVTERFADGSERVTYVSAPTKAKALRAYIPHIAVRPARPSELTAIIQTGAAVIDAGATPTDADAED